MDKEWQVGPEAKQSVLKRAVSCRNVSLDGNVKK